MSLVKFGLLPHHMTFGERPRGKRGLFRPLSTPLSAFFHSKPIRLPREEWKETERGRNCKFLTFDSISTSGIYESDVLKIKTMFSQSSIYPTFYKFVKFDRFARWNYGQPHSVVRPSCLNSRAPFS